MDETIKEVTKMGFEFAYQFSQQLITLSTAILALTITFTKDIVKNTPSSPFWVLKLAWVIFLLSICFGLWTMGALTGTLTSPIHYLPNGGELVPKQPYIIGESVRLPSGLQFLSFLVGILLIIIYGAMSLRNRTKEIPDGDLGKD